jgi:hypothetical protein
MQDTAAVKLKKTTLDFAIYMIYAQKINIPMHDIGHAAHPKRPH